MFQSFFLSFMIWFYVQYFFFFFCRFFSVFYHNFQYSQSVFSSHSTLSTFAISIRSFISVSFICLTCYVFCVRYFLFFLCIFLYFIPSYLIFTSRPKLLSCIIYCSFIYFLFYQCIVLSHLLYNLSRIYFFYVFSCILSRPNLIVTFRPKLLSCIIYCSYIYFVVSQCIFLSHLLYVLPTISYRSYSRPIFL